ENCDAPFDPETQNVAECVPKVFLVVGPEVDRVDVLILLGWVLRVADRAIGAVGEPLGVFRNPWVVRRALNGEVEGHVDLVPFGFFYEVVEVLERAEVRVHGRMPAVATTDGPGAANIVGFRL